MVQHIRQRFGRALQHHTQPAVGNAVNLGMSHFGGREADVPTLGRGDDRQDMVIVDPPDVPKLGRAEPRPAQ